MRFVSSRGWLTTVGIATLLAAVAPKSAQSAPTIYTAGPLKLTFYNNGDTDGSPTTGTQDWTQQQINDVVASAGEWTTNSTAHIGNTPGRQVEMHLFWGNLGTGVLGSSFNPLAGDGSRAWTFTELVYRQGEDYTLPNGYYYDNKIVYDADAATKGWNFGAGLPTGTQIDFRSVITHEIGHALGFASTYTSTGPTADTWWAGGITAWDSHLIDSAGNRPAVGSTGTPGNFNQLDNPVYFDGTYAVSANGGNAVPIYAPDPFEPGSSLTHLDDSGGFTTALMSHSIGSAQYARSPNAVEWAIMRDLGWQVVPEPGTLTMLFGLAGAALVMLIRRRGA
jgi:hypothetical protein